MSLAALETEVSRFLASEKAEVLCITGKWGVGKTFAWNQFLLKAKSDKRIALNRYAYVSLFGLSSLEELKYSVFENSVTTAQIGTEPSLETLQSNAQSTVERLGRKYLRFFQQAPIIKNYAGALGPIWFLAVKNTIVCFDDLERAGKGLDIKDVLGLASNLAIHKSCKVVLILNDDALDEEKKKFERFFEKVIDRSLHFAPTPQEAANVVLQDRTSAKTAILADSCISLGLSNIRIIKKIQDHLERAIPIVEGLDEGVLKQAIQTMALLTWSIHAPDEAPSIEFLKNRRRSHTEPDNFTEEEAAWNALLDAYPFTNLDEFDLALLDGIRQGYFDEARISKTASTLDAAFKAAKESESFEQTWELFHDSFDNNQDEFLDALYASFKRNYQHISPMNLDGTVRTLKELGREEQARELIQFYVDNRQQDPALFNLQNYSFREKVSDSDVTSAFAKKFDELRVKRDPATILEQIAKNKSWSQEDLYELSTVDVDTYYALFKRIKGRELRRTIAAALQFDRISNASEPMKEITTRVKEALTRIATESDINALRLRNYGITVKR